MCGYFHSVRFANFFFFYVRSFVLFSFWMTFFMYMRIMMISLWLCLFVCRDLSACSHVDSSTFMLGLHLLAYHTNIPWASRWIAVATAVVSQTGWTESITRIFFSIVLCEHKYEYKCVRCTIDETAEWHAGRTMSTTSTTRIMKTFLFGAKENAGPLLTAVMREER